MKKIILITDEETLDLHSGILVDENVDVKSLKDKIQKIKNEKAGEWTVTDILENISVEYTELEVESIYI